MSGMSNKYGWHMGHSKKKKKKNSEKEWRKKNALPQYRSAEARRLKIDSDRFGLTYEGNTGPNLSPDYYDYMLSEQWQDVRRIYFERIEKKCALCSSKEYIQLHHLTYVHFKKEWWTDLIPLCDTCHENTHKDHTVLKPLNLPAEPILEPTDVPW